MYYIVYNFVNLQFALFKNHLVISSSLFVSQIELISGFNNNDVDNVFQTKHKTLFLP